MCHSDGLHIRIPLVKRKKERVCPQLSENRKDQCSPGRGFTFRAREEMVLARHVHGPSLDCILDQEQEGHRGRLGISAVSAGFALARSRARSGDADARGGSRPLLLDTRGPATTCPLCRALCHRDHRRDMVHRVGPCRDDGRRRVWARDRTSRSKASERGHATLRTPRTRTASCSE